MRLQLLSDFVLERHIFEDGFDDEITTVEVTVLGGRLDQGEDLLRLLGGHAAALHPLVEQRLTVGLALLCPFKRDVLEHYLDTRHGRYIGNTLPHHAGTEHTQFFRLLRRDVFGSGGPSVYLIKVEEESIDHIFGHRRQCELCQTPALNTHGGVKIHSHGGYRHVENLDGRRE